MDEAGTPGAHSTATPRAARGSGLTWLLAGVLAAAAAALHADPIELRTRPRATPDDVRRVVRAHYYRDVSERDLDYGAIRGMVAGLDPHSTFFTPDEAREFREDTDGRFAGLGIEITVERGYVTVIAPIEETPAFDGGLLPGDRIIAIDGQPREFATTDDATRLLRGAPGSRVTLTVLHEGAVKPEDVVLVRREIHVKTVKRPRLLDEDARIGYVRVTHFKPQTAAETRAAVLALLSRGMKGLVLDLRDNPGGLLDEAVELVNLFVDEGLIVRTVGKDPAVQSERFARPGVALGRFPLALLVNSASASASEVVAGALKDLGRATIVGSRTHGKGSVQTLMPLADGSLLKLTTSHYFTRSGRPIHREANAKDTDPWGIMPDVKVDLDVRRLVEIYRRRDGLDFYGAEPAAATPTAGLAPQVGRIGGDDARDPQLEAAVSVLRERLAAPPAEPLSGPISATSTATR